MTIAAIPTRYHGVNFRSRLEARWAAFFDLAGWEWRYEPTDFNGWIPDFLLSEKYYVEVKPITWTTTGRPNPMQLTWGAEDLKKVRNNMRMKRKVEDAYAERLVEPILILGSGRPPCVGEDYLPEIGVFFSELRDTIGGPEHHWIYNGPQTAVLVQDKQRRLEIVSHGDATIWRIHDDDSDLIPGFIADRLWDEAGNITQWKPVTVVA